MGKLIAINISEKRGTEKKEIQEAQLVTDFGLPEMHMQVNGTGRSVFYLLKNRRFQSQRSQNRKRILRGESDRLRI